MANTKPALPIKPIPSIVAIIITLIFWFVIPVPEGIDPNGWHLLAIFIGTIAAIIGKALPIGALSIIAIALVAVLRVTDPNAGKATDDALSALSNNLIWLIGISIIISASLKKTGLGERIGYYVISLFGKNSLGIAYSLVISEFILSPVTPSNTARGGGIIHPIMRSVADSFDSKVEDNTTGKIGKFLALVNYNANPITSAMFITATAPNPLIVNFISQALGSSFRLTWGVWALAAIVPGIVSLLIMPLVIYWLYPPEIRHTPDAPQFAKARLIQQGKMTAHEKITLGIFVLMLLLWAEVPKLLFGASFAVTPTATAFIGLSVLLLTGVLTWNDVLSQKSAWDTIIWFSALLMMASFLGKYGIDKWVAERVLFYINYMHLGWFSGCLALILIYVFIHYFFASTTAHISAMFFAFLIAGISLGAPKVLYALLMAFSSSLMMSVTHYATGTAPVIYGSGYTTLGEWWKTGFVMIIVNLLIWGVVGSIWWRILGYW